MLATQLHLVFSLLLAALLAQGSPVPEYQLASREAWPAGDSTFVVPKRQLDNGERLRRGLGPLKPARLYDPSRVHSAPNARASLGRRDLNAQWTYTLDSCGAQPEEDAPYSRITATSRQGAVDRCAGWADADGTVDFAVRHVSGQLYHCAIGAVQDGAEEECDGAEWAYYSA